MCNSLQTKNLIGDDIADQTDQALKNLGAILGKQLLAGHGSMLFACTYLHAPF